jgi:hypothetical protein
MLDWDINHHLLQNFSEKYFPNSHHVAHETWIGIENFVYTVACIHPNKYI